MTARRFDMHTHSTVSDGVLDPADVVRAAADAGLDGIALTDHDSLGGLDEARAAGAQLGIEVLTGCEVSAQVDKVSVHVLGYFMDESHPKLLEELQWIQDDRVVRAEAMVGKLQELGVPVTMEMVRAHAEGDSIGRPHVAAAMVDAGVIATTVDAFTPEWILEGGRAYVPKRVMTPEDTIRLIVDAGGVAGIAHAIWVEHDIGDSIGNIERWTEAGLGALEVYHPEHDDGWRETYRKLAERLDLVITGSSDVHGNKHGGGIGENATIEEVVDQLRARATSTPKTRR